MKIIVLALLLSSNFLFADLCETCRGISEEEYDLLMKTRKQFIELKVLVLLHSLKDIKYKLEVIGCYEMIKLTDQERARLEGFVTKGSEEINENNVEDLKYLLEKVSQVYLDIKDSIECYLDLLGVSMINYSDEFIDKLLGVNRGVEKKHSDEIIYNFLKMDSDDEKNND